MPNNLEKLNTITNFAAAFKDSVEQKFVDDPAIKARLINTLRPGEMENIQDQLEAVLSETVIAGFGGITERLIHLNLALVDTMVDLSQRVLSTQDLLGYIPQELKNNDSADILAANKAPKLAALCRPPQP